MIAPWIAKASFAALWIAGTGIVLAVWLSWLSGRWIAWRRREALLGPVRGEKAGRIRDLPFLRGLAEEMDVAGLRWPAEALVGGMLFVAAVGWLAVDAAIVEMQQRYALDADRLAGVNNRLLNSASAGLLGSLPYFYVKFRLQRKRHRIALDMIKLVQNIVGHYAENRTVQELVSRSAPSMPEYVRDEWKRLELRSHLGGSLEEALYDFARRADNAWAEDVADILLIKHKYGHDVLDALHKLIVDMQRARKNEERRLAMITVYRIGTGVMVLFAFGIVFFNVFADGANYRHYFLDPTGQAIMLLSSAVLFASMVLVVKTGRRTF
ncbi:MAG TPA: type II secretion system F family protein [Paenibacillus sp.]|nr:type II secretion system F family protein [Paenibacillus sp.]